jgi:hypothetical protein
MYPSQPGKLKYLQDTIHTIHSRLCTAYPDINYFAVTQYNTVQIEIYIQSKKTMRETQIRQVIGLCKLNCDICRAFESEPASFLTIFKQGEFHPGNIKKQTVPKPKALTKKELQEENIELKKQLAIAKKECRDACNMYNDHIEAEHPDQVQEVEYESENECPGMYIAD